MCFHDTKDYFIEPAASFGLTKVVSNHLDNCKEPQLESDVEKLQSKKEGQKSRYLDFERRKKLPDPVEKEKGVSLWYLIKDNVGKDLTRVCLPVYFNEPLSSLQKCCEDMEYSYLLDKAYEYGRAVRLISITCFQIKFSFLVYIFHANEFEFIVVHAGESSWPACLSFFSMLYDCLLMGVLWIWRRS